MHIIKNTKHHAPMHQSESSLLLKVKSKSRATKYLQPDERWSKKQRSKDFPVFLEKI